MPYTGISDPSLPKNVLELGSAVRKRQWLHVYDSEKAKGASDADAIIRANGVIKKQMGHSMAVSGGSHQMVKIGTSSYSSINDPALPASVKSLPAHYRHQWLSVYSAARRRGTPDATAQNMADGLVRRVMSRTVAASGSSDNTFTIDEVEEIIAGMHYYTDAVAPAPDDESDDDDDFCIEDYQLSQDEAQYDPYGASGGQGCATCQWFIPPNSCVTVSGTISPTGKSNQFHPRVDESGSGSGNGNITAVTIVDQNGEPVDLGSHAVWTTVYENNLPDSSFAYVEPGGSKDKEGKTVPRTLRHFPYKDSSGKLDEAHVRDALGRIPQSTVSASAKSSALSTMRSAAKTLGISVSASSVEPSSGVSKVAKNAYRAILGFLGLEELGDPEPVLVLREGGEGEIMTPPGRLRYWAVSSNNFGPDNKGLEFPEVSQQEYVDWVWEKPEERMPELQGWHTPGTRLGQADWIDFDGHFRHSTGLIDVGREDIARDLASDPDMAMSHGYVVVWDRNRRAKVARSYEESILPREHAGNSFTSFGLEEDDVAFSEQRKKFLRERFGLSDGDITARENRWQQFGAVLEQLGIGFHELEAYVDSERVDASTPAPAPAPAQAGHDLATDGMTPESLVAMIASVIDQRIAPLQQAVATVQASQQALGEWQPRSQPVGFAPATDPSTVPGVTQAPDGQPVLSQHALDPRIVQAIAAGAQSDDAQKNADPINWMFQKLTAAGNPLLNGRPTEVRG